MIKKLREKKSEDESMDTQFMLSDQVNLLFQYLALLKADFLTNVAEWEEEIAENPKMTELKAYKNMLETAKKLGSF